MTLYITVINVTQATVTQSHDILKNIESFKKIMLYYMLIVYNTRNSIKFSCINSIQGFSFDLLLSCNS